MKKTKNKHQNNSLQLNFMDILNEDINTIYTNNSQKTLAIIDVSSFIYRAFYGFKDMRNSDNEPISAVFGVCSMLLSFLSTKTFDNIVAVFDSREKNFRFDLYPQYKQNRKPTPDALLKQMHHIRPMLESFGLKCDCCDGFEADDLIASYALAYEKQNFKITVVSSDKDLMQLINENIVMYDSMKNMNVYECDVFSKFNVHPYQILDYLALVGDVADNIPGVPGMGPKTASSLLGEFKNIEGIYNNIDLIKKQKIKLSLIENKKDLDLSYSLVKLRSDLNVCFDTEFNGFYQDTGLQFINNIGIDSLQRKFLNACKQLTE